MLTPQQVEEISFKKATFGGYDMQAVDDFLEPLTQDYITLYKENALLKSKMRVLVSKLEEYRENEAAMTEAAAHARETADRMVQETEQKCAQMLQQASQAAADSSRNASALIAEETARVEEARRVAATKISELQKQLNICLEMLERIKDETRPTLPRHTRTRLYDTTGTMDKSGALAKEITHNLEARIGTLEDGDMKTAPGADSRFGKNHDPIYK